MAATVRIVLSLTGVLITALIALAIKGNLAPADAALYSFFAATVIAPGVLATIYAHRHHI